MNAHYRNPEAPRNPRTLVDITPEAFERIVLDWLTDSAGQSGLEIDAKYLGVVNGSGGDYKIDVLVTFTVFGGAEVVVLVECKHHRSIDPIVEQPLAFCLIIRWNSVLV